jgi:hypothetical protein
MPCSVHVPSWLTLAIAIVVIAFGLYRMRLALRKPNPEADAKRGGYYRMAPRTHALVGIVYLLLGGALIATTFGWNPLGGLIGASRATSPPVTNGGITVEPTHK